MPSDGYGQEEECDLRPPPLIDNRDDAEAYCKPHHSNRDDLDAQRYGTILAEIADIEAQAGVIQQPLV